MIVWRPSTLGLAPSPSAKLFISFSPQRNFSKFVLNFPAYLRMSLDSHSVPAAHLWWQTSYWKKLSSWVISILEMISWFFKFYFLYFDVQFTFQGDLWEPLPYLIYGIFGTIAGGLTLLLSRNTGSETTTDNRWRHCSQKVSFPDFIWYPWIMVFESLFNSKWPEIAIFFNH